MTPDCDLLIVGAGFAGLAAGRAAAERGLKVVIAEAKHQIGVKLHTTGILVKEAVAALPEPPPDRLVHEVRGVRLYAPSRRTLDLWAKDYFFLTSDTGGLLRWMAEKAAAAGAAIRLSAPFRGGAADGAGATALLGATSVTARWLLGADGARSAVARAFGLGRNVKLLSGLEREYAAAPGLDGRFLHCFLDSRTAPGYLAWAAPAPGMVQVGLAVRHGASPRLKPFLAEAVARFGVDPGTEIENRAGRIPCGGLVSPWARGRVTLIGDAAGMVSPATGGGIKLALELGRAAGLAIAAHLREGAAPPEAALLPLLPRFGAKLALRRALDAAPANWAIEAAIGLPPFRALARRIYFGDGTARA